MKRIALLAVLLVVSACGLFGTAQAHTLSLAYKAGDTYKYKLQVSTKQTATMSATSIPITLEMTANESVNVKSVDPTGIADLTVTLSELTMKTVANGVTNTTTGIPTSTFELHVKADGTIVSTDGEGLTGGGGPLTAFSGLGGGVFISAVLPDNAVKAGDTWSKTYDQALANMGDGTLHVVSDSKYLRDETVGSVSAAVVETKSTASLDFSDTARTGGLDAGFSMKGTVTTDVTTWIDPNDHRIVKSHSLGHEDLTLAVPTAACPPAITQPAPATSPCQTGPLTASGDSTTDLTPA